jgi:hypothetical protein
MTSDAATTMVLHDPSPSTLYFADRPEREVGHVATVLFVDMWDQGEYSFAADPPNAVLSFAVAEDRPPEDVVVVLHRPTLETSTLTYEVDTLRGALPTSSGPCALFIDPIGRPLAAMSIVGMHRRERRRVRSF